jgi:NitT/TauT family transport system substrate-binding protein
VRSRLLTAGAVQLFDSRQISGEIVDVLVIRKSHLEQYPEQARDVINHWFSALDYFANHTDDAVARMTPRMQLPAAEVMAMYEGLTLPNREENRRLLTRTPDASEPLRDTLHQLNRIMQEQKLLSEPVNVEQICINATYL